MGPETDHQAVITDEVDRAFDIAERARSRGEDPVPSVEIPVATDMADRVENLLGIEGIADRIRKLEAELGRERTALELARGFAEGEIGDFETDSARVDAAVRTAVALLTEGVVAAPIEGIDRVEVDTAADGSRFVRIWYAGPIRSAGGTAQALSVLVADYTRSLLDVGTYEPTEREIDRLVEEVQLYEKEVGLQYTPTDAETRLIAKRCPVMLDGEPTTEDEVDSYRDLDRIETNRGRGGMCLVLAEGIAQKANKLQRYIDDIDDVDWPWLAELRGAPAGNDDDEDAPAEIEPDAGFLKDLIAGRPVMSHPSEPGGFRLRYGRARNHGHATAGVHPATMRLLDDFLAPGTQLKTERPGKAAGVVPVDTMEGPTVRLGDGSVERIDDPERAIAVRSGVTEIIDLGEYLVNVGEFVENNHPLLPGAFDQTRWEHAMEAAGFDLQPARDAPEISISHPSPQQALSWARDYDAPLHPRWTYLYHDLSIDELEQLADAIDSGAVRADEVVLDGDEAISDILGRILVEHEFDETLHIPTWRPLVRTLGFDLNLTREWTTLEGEDPLAAINAVSPFEILPKAPTRIGARVGRPEKSEARELSPAVHCLYPIGEAGGDRRSITEAATYAPDRTDDAGTIEVELNRRQCPSCGMSTFRPRCPDCANETRLRYTCPRCERPAEADESGRHRCERCEVDATCVEVQSIDVDERLAEALAAVEVPKRKLDVLKGVKGLTSSSKTPEPLEKGILRSKHNITVFKDGTSRYDMTDLPVTAVRPSEVGVSVDAFLELGYTTDIEGEPLAYDDQVVELHDQDLVLSWDAAAYLKRNADFVDELLESYYGLDPYYELEDESDLVGELVLGLAPHTSAAVVGRVVGFTDAAVGFAHPFFHAAKRRNCFHPSTTIAYDGPGGETETTTLEQFVESRLESPTQDDFGTLVQSLSGTVSVPSVTADGRRCRRPVTAVSRHVAPDHLVQIKSRSGQTVTVTPDHAVFRYRADGHLEHVRPTELQPGDAIPAATGQMAQPATTPARTDGGSTAATADTVATVDIVESDVAYTYSLTVEDTHTFLANGLFQPQCDGDEDCVMLLLDGLLNFSRYYLPDARGGRMDAPLVLSTQIDPAEIDDEAHNIETVSRYPPALYEQADMYGSADDTGIALAEDAIDVGEPVSFGHTDDPSDIAAGPNLSAYKTLDSMEDKLQGQLKLARRIRAVDEQDVAERVIESHYLPDLQGNLRAFVSQETRCRNCGTKYRRVPLSGECHECGGPVSLTVFEGMVVKYLETAMRIAETYDVDPYLKQRIEVLELTLDSLFTDDTDRQAGIADFM